MYSYECYFESIKHPKAVYYMFLEWNNPNEVYKIGNAKKIKDENLHNLVAQS